MKEWLTKNFEKLLLFTFGVGFIITILILAIKFPYPTTYQANIFRIILSLSASAFVVFLPGAIEIETKIIKNFAVKAAGGFAVFTIVYLLNPPSVLSSPVNTLKPATGLAYSYYHNYLTKVIKRLDTDSEFKYINSPGKDTLKKSLTDFRFIICIPKSPDFAALDNLKSLSKTYIYPVYLFVPEVNRYYSMCIPRKQKDTSLTIFLDIPAAVNIIDDYADKLVSENRDVQKEEIIKEEMLIFKQTLLELFNNDSFLRRYCQIRDINPKATIEDIDRFFKNF